MPAQAGWVYEQSTSTVRRRLQNGGELCLQPSTFHISDGDLMMALYDCRVNASAQRWTPLSGGRLLHSDSGNCLDIHAGTGPGVQLYHCTDGANQKWRFDGGTLESGTDLCLEQRPGPPESGSNDALQEYITNETKIFFAPNSGETLEVIRLASRALQEAATLVTVVEQLATRGGGTATDQAPDRGAAGTQLASAEPYSAAWLVDLFRGFATEQEMYDAATGEENLAKALASVVFFPRPDGTLPSRVKYAIRMDSLRVPDPAKQRQADTAVWGSMTHEVYQKNGFTVLQDMFDRAIIDLRSAGPHLASPALYAQRFPVPSYVYDRFPVAVGSVLPLFMVLAWIYTMALTTKAVVYEKEHRLREAMKMMGLTTGVHLAAWFLTTLAILLPSVALMALIVKQASILALTSGGVLFCFLLLFALASTSLALLLSSFFNKARLAAACTGIIYFCLYLPFIFIATQDEGVVSHGVKVFASLSSTTAFGLGVRLMAAAERAGTGAQWSTLGQGLSPCDSFSLASCFGMLVLDTALYLLLAWYMQQVFPGEYGVPRHPLFLLQREFWLGSKTSGRRGTASYRRLENTVVPPAPSASCEVQEAYEQERTRVAIRDVGKTFPGSCSLWRGTDPVTAVSSVSLDVLEGQITALLGHNGAGKSTLMGILSGLFPATSGDVSIYGCDARHDMAEARRHLGVCPQHNVLFDGLTAEEHLVFAARLKGLSWLAAREEAARYLGDLGLEGSKGRVARHLSGGMKRKLCVCMAFVGRAKFVILDEPTAGMDPRARRKCWDLLIRYKQRHTILISTHHMDEADVLADRIAIMAAGRLRCVGSPMFLKRRYGAGHHLVVSTDPDVCRPGDLEQRLRQIVPSLRLHERKGPDLTFRIPSADTSALGPLLGDLEAGRGTFGVCSYGVSATTLEEVFLNVMVAQKSDAGASVPGPDQRSNGFGDRDGGGDPAPAHSSGGSDTRSTTPGRAAAATGTAAAAGFALRRQRFVAMLQKRFRHARRDKKAVVSQIMLPAVFVCIAMWVATAFPMQTEPPQLNLSVAMFDNACHGTPRPNVVLLRDDSQAPFGGDVAEAVAQLTASHLNLSSDEAFLRPAGHCGPACNISANFSSYLLDTHGELGDTRFGGISLQPLASPTSILSSGYSGAQPLLLRPWFDPRWLHSLPAFLNLANNALLRAVTGDPRQAIDTINWPLNKSLAARTQQYLASGTDLTVAINILIAMAFIPASFAVFVVGERSSKAKHLQFTSGMGPFEYWLGNYAWDLFSYIVPMAVILAIFLAFGLPAYSGRNFPAIAVLFLLYGWSITPMMYPLSFLFSVPSTAYVAIICINLFVGVTCTLTTFLLDLFPTDPSLEHANSILRWVFLVFPSYALGRGLMDVARNEYDAEYHELVDLRQGSAWQSPLSWDVVGKNAAFMAAEGVVYFAAILLVERLAVTRLPPALDRLRRRRMAPAGAAPWVADGPGPEAGVLQEMELAVRRGEDGGEELDVAREASRVDRVAARPSSEDSLVVHRLAKTYRKGGRRTAPAVDGISFGVRRGECFGLLGVNGAGKTSTFRMITGDAAMTAGDVWVRGHSVRDNLASVRESLGYTPQVDALCPLLTGRETLQLYAMIRGIGRRDIPGIVADAIDNLDLGPWADRLSSTYSGGNKRKLSVAVALLGDPAVLLLDEPTAGMDPGARRFLWSVILQAVADGRSVLLTSHAMDECQALCSRLAIMVNGRFVCLGSPQHIRDKYGDGYGLTLKLDAGAGAGAEERQPASGRLGSLKAQVARLVPGSRLEEEHQLYLRYTLPRAGMPPLAELFDSLERCRSEHGLEDYVLGQTSMDAVFCKFADQQDSDRGALAVDRQSRGDLSTAFDEGDDVPMLQLQGEGLDRDKDQAV